MEKNIGKIDQGIRVILVILLIYLGIKYSYWWYLFAAIMLFTLVTRFCLLYKLLGIKTN